MGSPSMNLVKANVAKTSNGINIKVNVNGKEKLIFKDNRKINLPEKVIFGVRPENIFEDISKKKSKWFILKLSNRCCRACGF